MTPLPLTVTEPQRANLRKGHSEVPQRSVSPSPWYDTRAAQEELRLCVEDPPERVSFLDGWGGTETHYTNRDRRVKALKVHRRAWIEANGGDIREADRTGDYARFAAATGAASVEEMICAAVAAAHPECRRGVGL